jgi:beta-1,4-glucosyltransferase
VKTNISAIIITKNEEHHIADCCRTVGFCDQCIVVDDESSDATRAIAEEMGATVYTRAMEGDYAAQQNFAISKATGDWLLFIDADERLPFRLQQEILNVTQKSKSNKSYAIHRLNYFAGKKVLHGPLRPDWIVRLTPKEGAYFIGRVHQQLKTPYPVIRLKQPMLHFTYPNWQTYYQKNRRYAQLSAEKFIEQQQKGYFFIDLGIKPLWAFINMYFVHRGFIDGRLGFALAANFAAYTLEKYTRFHELKDKFKT